LQIYSLIVLVYEQQTTIKLFKSICNFIRANWVGAIIGSLIAAGMWTSMTGGSIFTMEKDMLNPAFTNAARWIQLVAAGLCF
jgi:hypothetical protein